MAWTLPDEFAGALEVVAMVSKKSSDPVGKSISSKSSDEGLTRGLDGGRENLDGPAVGKTCWAMAALRFAAAEADVLLGPAKALRAVERPVECDLAVIAAGGAGLCAGNDVVRLKVVCCIGFNVDVADAVMLSTSARKESSTKNESSSKSSDIMDVGQNGGVKQQDAQDDMGMITT
jgi:hypothetical protein